MYEVHINIVFAENNHVSQKIVILMFFSVYSANISDVSFERLCKLMRLVLDWNITIGKSLMLLTPV